MMKIELSQQGDVRKLRSDGYNWNMNMSSGFFTRWGKTFGDDPDYGLPEIADIEISEVCHGVRGVPCPFCYKSNVGYKGANMSLDTYRTVIDNLLFLRQYVIKTTDGVMFYCSSDDDIITEDKQIIKVRDLIPGDVFVKDALYTVDTIELKQESSLSQVALGIGDIDGNPDLKEIILHTRKMGFVPNITINGDRLTDEWVDFFSKNLGAIAVSVYDKELSYNAIKRLTDAGMTQCNIHFMVSVQTEDMVYEIMNDTQTDPRLEKLNALVLLSLKQKGRGENFNKLPQDNFTKIVQYGMEKGVGFGFDSCSAFRFLKSVEGHKDYDMFKMMTEPCESTCFSMYINTHGDFYPCSFTENTEEWETGLTLADKNIDFLRDIWFHPRVVKVRRDIIKTRKACKSCFYFDV